MLPTALFKMRHAYGMTHNIRAIIDSGAQTNLMTLQCAQKHNLTIHPTMMSLKGIGTSSVSTIGRVRGELLDEAAIGTGIIVEFIIVPYITSNMPIQLLDANITAKIKPHILADDSWYMPAPIEAIIGAGTMAMIMFPQMQLLEEEYVAQSTSLGWVIFGSQNSHMRIYTATCNIVTNEQLNESLLRLWQHEQGPKEVGMSAEDKWCEEHFERTYTRDASGRFVIEYPIKPEKIAELGNTREGVMRMFYNMERRLERNPEWKEKYVEFMRAYANDGHMQLAQEVPDYTGPYNYIPHHALPADKKFRIVFNGSFASSTGVSFNDLQCAGPRIQKVLFQQIIQFRVGKYAMTADVKKMFRQVRISPKQYNLQRIFWRESSKLPLREYQLTVVTYGLRSSAYVSVKAMMQCGKENEEEFPLAAEAISGKFYMDDYLESDHSLDKAIEKRRQLEMSLEKGGFALAKWAANNVKLLKSDEIQSEKHMTVEEATSVLGLSWNPERDILAFKLKEYGKEDVITRRVIASESARLYDPNGYITPIMIRGKMLMQDAWRTTDDWDEGVSKELALKWNELRKDVPNVERIQIPRWLGITAGGKMQLHIFADASRKAMGAVAYTRFQDTNGKVIVSLLTSKSRVAQLAVVTIPRMELQAAVIAVEMAQSICEALDMEMNEVRLWSDSEVVLYWLRKIPQDLKVFIAHRVATIQAVTPARSWQHVKSEDNPADLISRGCTVDELIVSKNWWQGPEFLTKTEEEWPQWRKGDAMKDKANIAQIEQEIRKKSESPVLLLASGGQNGQHIESVLESHERLRVTLRVTAYVMRFVNMAKKAVSKRKAIDIDRPQIAAARINAVARKRTAKINGENPKKKSKAQSERLMLKRPVGTGKYGIDKALFASVEPVSALEYEIALRYWIRFTQKHEYKMEWKHLDEGNQIPPKSTLATFAPMIDEHGCIRMRGRIEHADLEFDQKHPYILPAKSPLARRLMEEAHINTLHGGVQVCMQYLRERYWITGLRNTMKAIIRNCVRCTRYRKLAGEQMMADLPIARVRLERPFTRCGVDYAGPFKLKAKTGRNTYIELKAYVAIFTCLSSRMSHLEVVSDATSAAFLAALDRMTARRGEVEEMRSDNGMQFVGGIKELEEDFKSWDFQELKAEIANRGIIWLFNTALAPHQGGIWEAIVKVFKWHLRRLIGDLPFTYEELSTITTRIEGVLNSRPLTALTDDPTDLTALTPAHFGIGRPIKRPIGPRVAAIPMNRLSRWKMLNKIDQQFAERWKKDYLAEMQQRYKWRFPQRNLQKDDMVFVIDDNLPPDQWLLGRIIEANVEKDGCVRTIKVRTRKGVYDRPVTKCCYLPTEKREMGDAPSPA